MEDIKGIKPWLIAQDIFTKVKDELVLEAIDVLHEQVNKKRISIEGHTVTLPEQPSDLDRDLFIVNNILKEADGIRSQYSEYMNKAAGSGSSDPQVVERTEELKKMLLAVSEIEMLMSMSAAANEMVSSVSMYVNESDTANVIAKAAAEGHDGSRADLMDYIHNSARFAKAEVFDSEEQAIIDKSISLFEEMDGSTTTSPHESSAAPSDAA